MRAALASATSLLALLLGARDGFASPIVSTNLSTVSFGDVLVGQTASLTGKQVATVSGANGTTLSITTPSAPFTGSSLTTTVTGTGATSLSSNFTFAPLSTGAATPQTLTAADSGSGSNSVLVTLTGTGVAPIESVSNNGTQIGRVGTTLTSIVTIANTGNGNLSNTGSISNLNGAVSSTLGIGVTASGGNASSVSLTDSSSTTLSYTYTPISRGTVSSTATIAFSNGSTALNNAPQTVSSVFVDRAVGPQYASSVRASINGAGATDTPTPVAKGSIGSASQTISFGSVGYQKSATVYLALQNTTNDPGAASLTNLTVVKYSIAGGSPSAFSISGLSFGSVITEGGQLLVPLTVTDNTAGVFSLNSSLTIFTDESAALGGTGDTFTYSLTALAVPEPASIAVLGAGLAGLAGLRRRRRGD